MNELNNEEQINTEKKESDKTKKCSEVPPVDIESISLEDPVMEEMALRRKVVNFPGVTHVGDCDIWNKVLTFGSDGKARFTADVRSTDSNDAWVFYGGISFWDRNDVFLWNSQKIVGPSMDGHHSRVMDVTFFYPAHLFDSISRAKIHRMHC
ncbi:DUF6294 family protein [Bacillus mycoides]|uniref:DUF6294 family protein n=1 Tax=Bacillus mycoides TaxID=1405 RepID=UPI001C92BCC3|nr:DUF6294 family protein [Bacillus mycoides]